MARINIEESWWSDPRRERLAALVGSPLLADGIMIRVWRIAQQYRGKNQGLIPFHVWEQIEANASIVQANLAKAEQDGIYVNGSREFLDWVVKKRENAQKGGKSSAEKRSKMGLNCQANAKQNEATASKPKQVQPSISGSISGSNSNSDSSTGSGSTTGSDSLTKNNNAHFDFDAAYKRFPRKEGKTRGYKIMKREVKSERDFLDLKKAIENYAEYTKNTELTFIKHFSTFMNEWRDWINPEIETSEQRVQREVEEALRNIHAKRSFNNSNQ